MSPSLTRTACRFPTPQDLDNRRQTELGQINDALLDAADEQCQNAPFLRAVTELSRAREIAVIDATGA